MHPDVLILIGPAQGYGGKPAQVKKKGQSHISGDARVKGNMVIFAYFSLEDVLRHVGLRFVVCKFISLHIMPVSQTCLPEAQLSMHINSFSCRVAESYENEN